MNEEKRRRIFQRLAQQNPTPTTELEYTTPFELLAAVLLSAQATDVSVNAATRQLFPRANTPQAIAALGVKGLEPFIRTIGLYRTKAKHLIRTCELLIEHHGGEVPESREALEALPGVGRKTANVVLNTAFGWDTIAVDTHIFRVSNRTRVAQGQTVLEVEKRLERLVPDEFKRNAHHWLIMHGRYVCKARRPECWRCIIHEWCEHRPKSLPPDLSR
jgi:endonuclease-3